MAVKPRELIDRRAIDIGGSRCAIPVPCARISTSDLTLRRGSQTKLSVVRSVDETALDIAILDPTYKKPSGASTFRVAALKMSRSKISRGYLSGKLKAREAIALD